MTPQEENARKAILAEIVFDGAHWQRRAAVLVEAGRVAELVPASAVPAGFVPHCLPAGAMLAPGFVDLQVNGGGGVLLNDTPTAPGMRTIARAHRQYGTTALLPTLISADRETILRAIAAAKGIAGNDGIMGLHLEGPFLNPSRAGVHPREQIVTAELDDLDWLTALAEVGRSVVTLAPECVPSGFIHALTSRGIRVCAGHSEASADIMQRAIAEGLSGVTHLFNAMPPLAGRAPGIIGMALADKRLIAGLIVDGLHVDPVSVRAAFAAKGADGIMLVTDAMPSVGGPDDRFMLGGREIHLKEGKLVTGSGTLAGAHLDMASAVRNAVRLADIPLEDALTAASLTPARFLGLESERGAIVPGARADFVALDAELGVVGTWVDGEFEAQGRD
jgi:N-acetylglucosamine-6-phosphate deacetylase